MSWQGSDGSLPRESARPTPQHQERGDHKTEPHNADDEPFALRWSTRKGWLRFRDPVTGVWDEVWSRDVPAWRRILIQQLRDEGRLSLTQVDDAERDGGHDRFRCDCYPSHEPCAFGLGMDCLNGTACTNPHHVPQRVIAP